MEAPIIGAFENIAFNAVPHLDLVRFIEDAILATSATTIVTHHPADLNNDHTHTADACQAAARLFQRREGLTRLNERLLMEVASSTDWAFPANGNLFAPNTFVELSMLDGHVIGDCMPRHRHQEFLRFLKKIEAETPPALALHLIVDIYATHKPARVKRWLARHPRVHLHFTPTSSSWLNLVERWFRDLTTNRIRRDSFESVPELIATIDDYVAQSTQNPHIFVMDRVRRPHSGENRQM